MTKRLYIAWQDPDGRSWYPVAQVDLTPPERYEFRYLEGARTAASKPGFPGIAQFGDMEVSYVMHEIFPFLVPSRAHLGFVLAVLLAMS